MVTLKPSEDGCFDLLGLSAADLDILDEALCMLFAQSGKAEHSSFRSLILQIHEPISEQLDKLSTDKLPTLF